MSLSKPNVAIVGATGAVGEALLELIEKRNFPYNELHLIGSSRSAGTTKTFQGKDYQVQDLADFDFSGVHVAFFSAGGSVSKEYAPKAAASGAIVVDNSSAFRLEEGVPLVVPQVNGSLLTERPAKGIIGNPNCSTIQMVRALEPLHQTYGLEQVIVSTYQAASGAGKEAMDELAEHSKQVLAGENVSGGGIFAKSLAFNVVPEIDIFLDNGFTKEEEKMLRETRKIMALPDLRLTATAVRVPVMNGHSEAVYLECEREVDRQKVIEILSAAEEIVVYDRNETKAYPTPRLVDQPDLVHVGRIRLNPDNARGLWLWVVADNLYVGAALNAIQIAEKLAAYNHIPNS